MYETVIQAKTTESKTLRFVWYIVIIGGIIGDWLKDKINFVCIQFKAQIMKTFCESQWLRAHKRATFVHFLLSE